MTEDERRVAYAGAFVAQARSDWLAYRLLESSEVPACHSLHYLQMVCEKVAKAYRLRDTDLPVDDLVATHSGFSKFISPFCTAALKDEYAGKDAQLAGLIRRARTLAREIEKLSPAIDRRSTPRMPSTLGSATATSSRLATTTFLRWSCSGNQADARS